MEQKHLLLEQDQVAQADEEELVRDLSAEEVLSADASALAVLLKQEARSFRKEKLKALVWAATFLLGIIELAVYTAGNAGLFLYDTKIFTALMIPAGIGLIAQSYRGSHRRKVSLAKSVEQNCCVDQIGLLIQALYVQNTGVRNIAKGALTSLLPTLQASDAALLGDAERKILLRQLSIHPNDCGYRDITELFSRSVLRREIDLRLSILKALE